MCSWGEIDGCEVRAWKGASGRIVVEVVDSHGERLFGRADHASQVESVARDLLAWAPKTAGIDKRDHP